jgi:hypothetical protein
MSPARPETGNPLNGVSPMKSLTQRIVWTVALVALLAPVSTAHAKDYPVPIKGTLTIVPESMSPFRHITGQVSHLGNAEGEILQTVNPNGSFSGNFKLYAANGDSLTGMVTGQLYPTNDPTVLGVIESVVFMGGTGRFTGATGTATGTGQVGALTGVALESFVGTISYPGSWSTLLLMRSDPWWDSRWSMVDRIALA